MKENESLNLRTKPAGTLETLAYGGIMITISGTVILYNKWILTSLQFPYPVALTMTHMAVHSILASIGVWSGLVPIHRVSTSTSAYITTILPIAGLFSIVLWLGNSAYLFLSVSFIQQLKALLPALVYIFSVSIGLTIFTPGKLLNICVICGGIVIASYGEIHFNLTGFSLQIASTVAEALRVILLQTLVQERGLQLNPVSTLYYIAPPCFFFLSIIFIFTELPKMISSPSLVLSPTHMIFNAIIAFALNVSIFAFVAKTSALTFSLAGIIKDWGLIVLSYLIFSSPISALNLIGYGIAFAGLIVWNRDKFRGLIV